MNEPSEAKIRNLLKKSLHSPDPELQRDLWPQMLRRLDEQSPVEMIPWLDWALLTVPVISILAFPHSILVLMYCL